MTHTTNEGRDCLCSLNATRTVFRMEPLEAMPEDDAPLYTPDEAFWDCLLWWCIALVVVLAAFAAVVAWLPVA